MVRFQTKLVSWRETGYASIIPVTADIAANFTGKQSARVICRINDRYEFPCALMPRGDGSFFIMLSKATLKKADLEGSALLEVEIRKDNSKYGMPMPEALQSVLDTDPEALERFESLTPGKRRSIMHYVGKAKAVDTQIDRALKAAKNLKLGASKPNEFFR